MKIPAQRPPKCAALSAFIKSATIRLTPTKTAKLIRIGASDFLLLRLKKMLMINENPNMPKMAPDAPTPMDNRFQYKLFNAPAMPATK
jgi:hypothetical protein